MGPERPDRRRPRGLSFVRADAARRRGFGSSARPATARRRSPRRARSARARAARRPASRHDGFEVSEQIAGRPDPPAVVLTSTRDATSYRRRLGGDPRPGLHPQGRLSGAALAALTDAAARDRAALSRSRSSSSLASRWGSPPSGRRTVSAVPDRAAAALIAGWALLVCGVLAARQRRAASRSARCSWAPAPAWFRGQPRAGALLSLHRGPLCTCCSPSRRPTLALAGAGPRRGGVRRGAIGRSAPSARSPSRFASRPRAGGRRLPGESGPPRRAGRSPPPARWRFALVLGGAAVAQVAVRPRAVRCRLRRCPHRDRRRLLADLEHGRWSQAR